MGQIQVAANECDSNVTLELFAKTINLEAFGRLDTVI